MMTRRSRYAGQPLAWVLAATALCAGCDNKPQVDSTTNWLRMCSGSSECGGLECVCGLCTTVCESDDSCYRFGERAECSSELQGTDAACMSGETSACVLKCGDDADCEGGLVCEAGLCGRQTANSCIRSNFTAEISVTNVDKVDLLFVIDDSNSMLEEQALLRDQLPRLVRMLTSGELLRPDGSIRSKFPAANNLHVGVVSSDMGVVGVEGVPSCDSGLGGDGRLQSAAGPVEGCASMYPPFLSFVEGDSPDAFAQDLQCVSALGTEGCGFEQPLEAGLKALWPAMDIDPATGTQWIDPDTGRPSNRITFLPDGSGDGLYGHGDGANLGFLRNDTNGGVSLIAVVVVTDKDDCSSSETSHFTPVQGLAEGDPLAEQPMGLRCFYNAQNLYSVDRYINGLQALRQGNEQLVTFTAVAGIPVDLVDLVHPSDPERSPTFDLEDDSEREDWYAMVLRDMRMVERIDETQSDVAKRTLRPSCGSDSSGALPPRRLVEVARGLGPNGMVQSICNPDFSGAMDGVVEMLGKQLGAVCLPRQLDVESDGAVACDVLWELPTPELAEVGVPTECGQREFLRAPDGDRPPSGDLGGNLCVVNQLPVPPAGRSALQGEGTTEEERDQLVQQVKATGEGWFYDDFSAEVVAECPASEPQRITFTDGAKPPTGVTVLLSCRAQQCTDDMAGAME